MEQFSSSAASLQGGTTVGDLALASSLGRCPAPEVKLAAAGLGVPAALTAAEAGGAPTVRAEAAEVVKAAPPTDADTAPLLTSADIPARADKLGGSAGVGTGGGGGGGIEPGDGDPFALLIADHERFRQLMNQWAAATLPNAEGIATRRAIVMELCREIVAHASAEERHLHELYRIHLPAAIGAAYFAASLEADQRNLEALRTLERSEGDALFGPETAIAFSLLRETELAHMADEEQVFFPALQGALTSEQVATLYKDLVRAKRWAPTYPHTWRPDDPLLAKLTHAAVGAADQLRDAVLGRT